MEKTFTLVVGNHWTCSVPVATFATVEEASTAAIDLVEDLGARYDLDFAPGAFTPTVVEWKTADDGFVAVEERLA